MPGYVLMSAHIAQNAWNLFYRTSVRHVVEDLSQDPFVRRMHTAIN